MDKITKNFRKPARLFLLMALTAALFCLGQAGRVEAGVIFEDDFDNTPDWQSTTQSGIVYPGGPQGWDAFRDATDDYGQPNHRVDSDYHRGPTGKAMTAAYENTRYYGGSNSINEQVEGGAVYKFIAPTDGVSGYDELYVAWWEKFHTWDWYNGPQGAFIKIMRIFLGVDTSNPSWESTNVTKYYTIINWRGNANTILDLQFEIRNPLCSVPGCMDDDVTNFPAALWPSDGQWHHNEFHIKLNTVGKSDGLLEYYQDGVKKAQVTNHKFRDTNIKVNVLVMMDNVVNDFEIGTENEYSIDDFVVSTSYIGPDYVIGGGLTADLNNDGTVDILDLQACANHILGAQDYGKAADVNGDGSVDVQDIQEIVNIILNAG